MNSVEGGESGRVGDKPDVIPVKNCKSLLITQTDHVDSELAVTDSK